MAELLGAGLGLEPRPVDLLALRAIEAAFLGLGHGPPRVAEGKLGPFVKPLPPGCLPSEEPLHDFVPDRRTQACISLGGEIVAVHLARLFKQGHGIERVAAAIACGSVAFPFATRSSIRRDAVLDELLLTSAREAAEAALRTGTLDVMHEKLAVIEGYLKARSRPSAGRPTARTRAGASRAAPSPPSTGPRQRRVATGFQRLQGAPTVKPVRLNLQFGADPHANRWLHLFNYYLAGVLEYLFLALCVANLGAACSMAEIAFNLFERQPYSYGFWALQWMNEPDRPASAHRDCNDAREAYAALVYFHPDGNAKRPLHRLRFPALGIALDLRHGDVVFIRGHILEHGVVADGDTDGRYCIVLTLGNNLKVDAKVVPVRNARM
eukprot:tig00000540_g1915.t1